MSRGPVNTAGGDGIAHAFSSFSHLGAVPFYSPIIKSGSTVSVQFACGPLSQMPQVCPVEIKGSGQGLTTGLQERRATWES